MKKVKFAAVLALLFLAVGCKGKLSLRGSGSLSKDASAIVAIVNGEKITEGDLYKEAKSRLQRIDTEVYKIKKDVLNDMIDDKLLKAAANKAGKSVDEYLKTEVDEKVTEPSDEEVKKFFEFRKQHFGGKKLEDVKDRIKEMLQYSKRTSARNALMARLRNEAKIEIKLEPPRIDVEIGNSPSIGPKNAKVTLVEFTDYECPYCRRVRPTINELISTYKDNLRYVLKDFPLGMHRFAKKAHEAAHCAGEQGKYWDYNKTIWANQSSLDESSLKEYAKKLKLRMDKFNECLESGKFSKHVEEDQEYGASIGVNGTPAFFINGIMLSGARPLADFKQMIDAELKK